MAILDPERVEQNEAPSPAAGKSRRSSGWNRFVVAPLHQVRRAIQRFLDFTIFSSLTRRIIVLNLAGLLVLVVGILYLNQWRAGLIDALVFPGAVHAQDRPCR